MTLIDAIVRSTNFAINKDKFSGKETVPIKSLQAELTCTTQAVGHVTDVIEASSFVHLKWF